MFCVLAVSACFIALSFGKETLPIACSPEKPVVLPGEKVKLRVWADSDENQTLTYDWEVGAGKVQGRGSEVIWDLMGAQPATYEATAYVAYPGGETQKCPLQVLVEKTEARGGITGWSLLLSGAKEKPNYGLYSYILFGSRPTDVTRERYLKTLEAYVSLAESIASLEASGIAHQRLNVTYVPVIKMPSQKDRPSAEWLLGNYDYGRARAILSIVQGSYRSEGPYIISYDKPLSTMKQLKEKYIDQDLTVVEPKVIYSYAREFFSQAAQERYWEDNTRRQLALKLQNTMYLMARALPPVKDAMKDLKDIKGIISWKE